MDHADPDPRPAARHRRIHPREVVRDQPVLIVPRRLVTDRSRIIPLRLARHRHPRQMRHPDGHAQRRLPVPMPLVAHEIEIPVGHAVEFGEHSAPAVLVRRAGRLLRGGELHPVAEHVDAGELEGAVAAHRFAERMGLRLQRRLLHHVPGEADAVLLAPAADRIGER